MALLTPFVYRFNVSVAGVASYNPIPYSKACIDGSAPSGYPTVSLNTPVQSGGQDPVLVPFDGKITRMIFSTVRCSTAVAPPAGPNVTVKIDCYKVGSTLGANVMFGTVQFPVSLISSYNDSGSNQFQYSYVSGINLAVKAGDMLGFVFRPEIGTNTGISTIGGTNLTVEIQS